MEAPLKPLALTYEDKRIEGSLRDEARGQLGSARKLEDRLGRPGDRLGVVGETGKEEFGSEQPARKRKGSRAISSLD